MPIASRSSSSLPPLKSLRRWPEISSHVREHDAVGRPASRHEPVRRPSGTKPPARLATCTTTPVGGRQAHMDVDLRAEIGDEFHRAGQAVVECRPAAPWRCRCARAAARASPARRSPPSQRDGEAAVGPEAAGRLDRARRGRWCGRRSPRRSGRPGARRGRAGCRPGAPRPRSSPPAGRPWSAPPPGRA